jgi:hypothetical protein
MDLDKLTERDSADFRNRMARLGMDEKAIIADVLEVEGTTKRLEMAAHSDQRPYILETSDLDLVRWWIGVPETVAKVLARQPHERVVLEGGGELPLPGRGRRRRLAAMRFKCANLISMRLRSCRDCSKASVPTRDRATSRARS